MPRHRLLLLQAAAEQPNLIAGAAKDVGLLRLVYLSSPFHRQQVQNIVKRIVDLLPPLPLALVLSLLAVAAPAATPALAARTVLPRIVALRPVKVGVAALVVEVSIEAGSVRS
jgi:hypothetical protein